MARRQAIAADELFETANRLKAEGKEVTALYFWTPWAAGA